MTTFLLWSAVMTLIGIGIVGIVFPLLPGATFLFAGMWLAAWIEDYQCISTATVWWLFVLMLLSFAADWLAGALGAKKAGATKAAIIGATLGSIMGVLVGFWGLLIFPFVGAVLGELLSHGDQLRASKVGFAAWLGVMFGLIAKIAIAFAMLGIFALAWFL
ncbi:DUF456 domain-containing protein [Permianibacter sp. IMCC34836]|uniref:DUF456 domain-containing protein n=1 Tax=Permianibacter fluminis TaxID=2738515 RepID=UPI001554A3A8|nr:DUF456 domain-containing protein [Permianibacter fluminis]NQD38524.1 DUF456 domain-containing protein [Permianibacter fluminis]